MLVFSEDLRRNCPEAQFDDAIRLHNDATVFLVPKVRCEDISLVAKIPVKVAVILQVGLRRGLDLAESIARELNAGAFISSFVLSRALLETACVTYDTWDRVENAINSPDTSALADFDKHVMAVLLGSRTEGWGHPEIFEAKNVVTIMERLDKSFGGVIMRFYADLSEHAHPNFAGMAGRYSQIDELNYETQFIDDLWKRHAKGMIIPVGAMAVSLMLLNVSLSRHQNSSGTLVRVCEEEIHRAGNWPQNVLYPWNS